MDETELKGIWNAYDKKLEKSLQLNLAIFEDLQKEKARSRLNVLSSIKISGVVIGMLWVLFLGVLLVGNHFKNIYFSTSVTMLMFFSIFAIAVYIKHLVLINQIDYSENITGTQKRLAELQVSTIRSTGVIWLQLPFYTTFFWNQDWMTNGTGFWTVAFPITLLFTVLAIWLYRNIRPEHMDKIWVRKLMMIGKEYQYALSASEMLQQVEEFKS